jgi:hypothetical protein
MNDRWNKYIDIAYKYRFYISMIILSGVLLFMWVY